MLTYSLTATVAMGTISRTNNNLKYPLPELHKKDPSATGYAARAGGLNYTCITGPCGGSE